MGFAIFLELAPRSELFVAVLVELALRLDDRDERDEPGRDPAPRRSPVDG